jgi:hypothetical protein
MDAEEAARALADQLAEGPTVLNFISAASASQW